MSPENVEIVRQVFEAFARGDIAAMLRDFDPDLLVEGAQAGLGTYHGPEGALQAAMDWVEDLDDWVLTPEDFVDAGDAVIVRVYESGRGGISGAPVEARFWWVFSLGRTKITRLAFFEREEQALEAVGLRE
jgi:ketosteroid isomerase-like protein